ncbi:hypothetical protein LZG04_23575 [Saccharothrix sp. S26]|uniref:hypothetical protein n=1 Tax=Saccharothrix sp. S26 TaxID=2907215 RepID=UPI001F33E472|nr:hypothetical protein [Saccharothrix sp. S26]MCE6997758.1 hypothetical protein [Saccharothrix sp. S26]
MARGKGIPGNGATDSHEAAGTERLAGHLHTPDTACSRPPSRRLLQVVGSRAVTSWMAVEVHQRAAGPKQLRWIEGASHVDLYDRKQYVEELMGFCTAHLTGS